VTDPQRGADQIDPTDPAAPQTYEQARAELEEVVRRLEAGGVPLEDSLALWERGEQLARQCQDWLDGARRRLAAAAEQPAADKEPDPAQ
jgi:exodeoxyribonuclease VII small subunit